jgi:hypothetical protein
VGCGARRQQPVSLANGVRLLPITAAPDSPNLRALTRRYRFATILTKIVGIWQSRYSERRDKEQ